MSVQPDYRDAADRRGLTVTSPVGEALDIRLAATADVRTGLSWHVVDASRRGVRLVLLDVSPVVSVTPSGLADLLHAVRYMRARGGDLRVYGQSRALGDALRALDLAKVLTVHPDREGALRLRTARPVPEEVRVRDRAPRSRRIGRRSRRADSN
ncbi:hypothetical protein [Gordonia sp. NPDC003376]